MDNMGYNPVIEPAGQPMAGQPMPWYQVWMQVITHPSRDSFRRILADPTARPARAFIWVAVISLIFGLLQAVLAQVLGVSPFSQFGAEGVFTNAVCIAIAAPIFSVIGLALGAAILRGIAALLKGAGNFNDLVYSLGAVQAPISIVSYLISLITTAVSGGGADLVNGGPRSLATLCILPFSLALGVYAVVLEVLAVDTVEKFGTGKAVLTVLIPVIVVILLGVCVASVVAIVAVNQFSR